MTNSVEPAPWAKRLVLTGLITAVFLLAGFVMAPFLASIAWAGLLAYITWPIHLRMRRWARGRADMSAGLMTLVTGAALVLPLLCLFILVQDDLIAAYRTGAAFLGRGLESMADSIARVPWVGPALHGWLNSYRGDLAGLKQRLVEWIQQESGMLLGVVGSAGRSLIKVVLTLVTLFFCYRDGEAALQQLRQALRRVAGPRADVHLATAGAMSRAVLLGVVVAGLIQGAIAALGYWAFGIGTPILLGSLTAVVSVVPVFGTFLVWGPIGLWLLLMGHTWKALGMLAWGVLLVHPADNLLRPLLVSSVVHVPFLVVMFGVLGGIAAFGLVGLFLGPVILTLALAIWREWVISIRNNDSS